MLGQDSREVDPYDTMVDIINDEATPATSISSGLASIYVNEDWGSVCNMKKADADSFCRQLGFTNAVSVDDRDVV